MGRAPTGTSAESPPCLDDAQYRTLLELRTGLRRFLRWSEAQARAAGLTPAQHQLLLAVRGLGRSGAEPTVGDIADSLLLRHHSAVELVDRAASGDLVVRHRDTRDHRVVRVGLTERGSRLLEGLATQHVAELARVSLTFGEIAGGLAGVNGLAETAG